MKIVITYERADILKLVEADLRARDMAVKPGTTLYKGALQVRLEIETEDIAAASTVADAPPVVAPPLQVIPPPPDEDGDMTSVLEASKRVIQSKPAPFLGRPLNPGESLEYPKG